jgi:acyl carrier protein
MTTFDKVVKILVDYNDCDASQITPETTLADLGLDSLDTVELVMNFEEEFGITIEMNEGLQTIADVVALIDSAKA